MSWDGYIQSMDAEVGDDKVTKINGIWTKAGAKCASSAGFEISPAELQVIGQVIEGTADLGTVKIEVNGQPCTMICASKEDGTVQVKTKTEIVESNKVFYHFEATGGLYVVCGRYGAGERSASKIANKIAAYLISLSY